MSGGISIALAIIAMLVIFGIIAFMYFTGGAVALSEDGEDVEEHRPRHKKPTTPAQENTTFIGTRRDE
jgi:hypothetical protein